MTINEVIKLCHEVADKHGFRINFPIRENGRLTSTLGRVMLQGTTVVAIEFSKRHLASATNESIKATVLHELAHAFVAMETKEDHGHDATFRAMCIRIGTDNYGTSHNNLKLKVAKEDIYKYVITCSYCGKMIATRSRACKLTQIPWNYQSNCCHVDIEVIQNW